MQNESGFPQPGACFNPPSPERDDLPLRFAWIVLLAIPVWLLFYRHPSPEIDAPPTLWLWTLYLLVLAVEAARTRLVSRSSNHPLLDLFILFDAVAIAIAIRWTGGILSEFWLLYLFILIAGALNPRPHALRSLGILVVLSYVAAVLPEIQRDDWRAFFSHLHLPGQEIAESHRSSGNSQHISLLLVRFFFLFVVAYMAQAIARKRVRQERELALLCEQVAVAEDRGRIARELHDSLNHTLIGSLLRLELCARLLRSAPDEAETILNEERTALRAALDSVRDYVFHLRPAELDEKPLDRLLREYAARFTERTGLGVETCIENLPPVSPAHRIAAARVVQEAMTNVVKHARATRIILRASLDRAASSLIIEIEDDGRGFDPAEARQGSVGMASMRERVETLGGTWTLNSCPGQGTRVKMVLPLPKGVVKNEKGAANQNQSKTSKCG